MVPVAVAAAEELGVYIENRCFGITTLDIVRANTFVSEVDTVITKAFFQLC